MHRVFPILVLLVLSVAFTSADVVRPAPDFVWLKSGAKGASLKSLRGQPVILIVAQSPRQRIFRSQVGQLQRLYQLFGNQRAVIIAAFTQEPGVIRSNIPFVLAANPAAVASSYGVSGDFAVFILGRDGNIDMATDRVLPAQRMLDIINNSYVVQRNNRRSN
ncbi:MAG: redoxin domain-containing protein [Chthoniobacterales bacterium]|nr:redoxin domain-containing protein [Chthoniobacterales bacterium]